MKTINCPKIYCKRESTQQLFIGFIQKVVLIPKTLCFDDLFSKYLIFKKLFQLLLKRLMNKTVYEKLCKLGISYKL